ncbi:hypothetical protein LTR70_001921 [Exophiala xenobiotica]|uniref:Tyrosine specific protein phosphatases domain-containing protein n=1 Tax=Lithohypha guttulata TaxID=1690604 RepID=A0ABR0K939_9EURO|nr:hypothetical protein LTR24_005407 [Lithohypha guttulata]KAK5326906.1 hypothetical protein LTR70_001921 [Exophiala xenobiotica]
MPGPWKTIGCTVIVVLGSLAYLYRRQRRATHTQLLQRAEDELHPRLKEHTKFRSYTTQYATYPRIRTYYQPHPHKDSHVDITELPLLVFIHGLGGVLPQFAGLLGSLTNVAPCFGLELPGHGKSTFAPKAYGAYTIEANVALWKTAIEDVCWKNGHKSVVLIGHSMGCSIAALLASTASTVPALSIPVAGMVAICPRAHQLTPKEINAAQKLSSTPNFIIDILRWFDRYGGENSTSVLRVVGHSNESDLKRTQLEWNRQHRTPVLKRITLGLLPHTAPDGSVTGGPPSEAVWKGLKIPLFLIAGESDTVCKPAEVDLIIHHMTGRSITEANNPASTQPSDKLQTSTNGLTPTIITSPTSLSPSPIQCITLPAPAAHALLYAHTTYRLVSALIESFLSTHVSQKLDFTHQLRLLTTSGKWDVKNLQKWKAVLPVSAPIDATPQNPNGFFRALKTMREQDDEHNPTHFLRQWGDKTYAVIDISHDPPVYNTKTLEQGGVEYHKFPTVSKIPPTPLEVQDFCILVDKLLGERDAKGENAKAVAVHCHYGYNRTGFFICSYLVLWRGYGVQDAIDEFARAKPPGIKHAHFLDQMWLRLAGQEGRMRSGRRSSGSAAAGGGKGLGSDEKDERGRHDDGGLAVAAQDEAGNVSEGDVM